MSMCFWNDGNVKSENRVDLVSRRSYGSWINREIAKTVLEIVVLNGHLLGFIYFTTKLENKQLRISGGVNPGRRNNNNNISFV